MMRQFTLSAAVLASSLLMAAPSFAQSTDNHPSSATSTQQNSAAAQKQHTQSDPTNTYLFKPESGGYSARPAQKQRTDGEDVTGNNNFAPVSK